MKAPYAVSIHVSPACSSSAELSRMVEILPGSGINWCSGNLGPFCLNRGGMDSLVESTSRRAEVVRVNLYKLGKICCSSATGQLVSCREIFFSTKTKSRRGIGSGRDVI